MLTASWWLPYLNTWSPDGGIFCETVEPWGLEASSEEVGHCGRALWSDCLAPLLVYCLFPVRSPSHISHHELHYDNLLDYSGYMAPTVILRSMAQGLCSAWILS